MRHAEIIAVGSELLLGGRVDTNSIWLSRWLAAQGIEVRFKSVVGDDVRDIASALGMAVRRARVVVLTGGLGPTEDDCTRQAVATLTRRPLRRNGEAWDALRRRLAAWGRTPSPAQRRQAFVPTGATVLHNPVGSAPGFCLTWRGAFIAAVPGVPAEAEQMVTHALAGQLERVVSGPRLAIAQRQLHTFGLPEPEVDRRLKGLARSQHDVRLGVLASPLGVSVTMTVYGRAGATSPGARARRLLDAARAKLGAHVYGEGDESMEMVVGRELLKRGLTLAVAESCTGGLIGHRLTQVPGSSAYVDRGALCYSNDAKMAMLGVPARTLERQGAVSAEVVAAMAHGMRRRSRAQVAISVTGIAGPAGGTDRKPVGLVYIGLEARPPRGSGRRAVAWTREFRFHGLREAIKLRASQAALDLLRRWLLGLPASGQ